MLSSITRNKQPSPPAQISDYKARIYAGMDCKKMLSNTAEKIAQISDYKARTVIWIIKLVVFLSMHDKTLQIKQW